MSKKGISGRGVLIDWYGWALEQNMTFDATTPHAIPFSQLLAALTRQNMDPSALRPGDILVVRSGYLSQYESMPAAKRDALDAQYRAARGPQNVGLEPSEEQAIAKAGPNLPADAATRWVPVIFVSSSMPIAVLRSYVGQLERVHGVLAFRGMPGGLRKAGPMAELTARILRRDPGCEGPGCAMRDVQVIVDPLVFRPGSTLGCAGLMAGAVALLGYTPLGHAMTAGPVMRIVDVGVLIGLGVGLYLAALHVLGVTDLRLALGAVKRRLGRRRQA